MGDNELERATLALHDVDCGCPSKVHSEERWGDYRDAARAVIAALTPIPQVVENVSTHVFEALGAASVCWEETPSGVFDSTRAKAVGDELMTYLTPLLSTNSSVRDLTEAIRLTVEYVGTGMLPPIEGWSWYDALVKYAPDVAEHFVEWASAHPAPTPDMDVLAQGHIPSAQEAIELGDARADMKALDVLAEVRAKAEAWDRLVGAHECPTSWTTLVNGSMHLDPVDHDCPRDYLNPEAGR